MKWLPLLLVLAGCDLPTEPPPWRWPAVYGCLDPLERYGCATPIPTRPPTHVTTED
jgi:hypothetical protein